MHISGIQQMGVGVPNVHEAWAWYRKNFGIDIRVFEEAAEAGLMLPYTGGEPRSRHAALSLNLQGGGGFEIWQYTSRTPQPPAFTPELGDLGIFITKIKSKDVEAAHAMLNKNGVKATPVANDPAGSPHFYVWDRYGNIFEIVASTDWFKEENKLTGGVYGAVLGVTDMDKSIAFYGDILGYDDVVYDQTDEFDDLKSEIPGGASRFRRVLLRHSKPRVGAFSQMLGSSEIELVQRICDEKPRKIFENRFWGDLGFIHLCFDIYGMEELKSLCESKGHPFTVDSANSFDMGEAAGRFSYIEDPDGALIEFVETHKVPVMKKIGWYINLKKRDPKKPLPNWLLKAFSLNRVKD
jgi:catechol 2,3-dioxygenase-like lactoylglutathione lyase family enzyme